MLMNTCCIGYLKLDDCSIGGMKIGTNPWITCCKLMASLWGKIGIKKSFIVWNLKTHRHGLQFVYCLHYKMSLRIKNSTNLACEAGGVILLLAWNSHEAWGFHFQFMRELTQMLCYNLNWVMARSGMCERWRILLCRSETSGKFFVKIT